MEGSLRAESQVNEEDTIVKCFVDNDSCDINVTKDYHLPKSCLAYSFPLLQASFKPTKFLYQFVNVYSFPVLCWNR